MFLIVLKIGRRITSYWETIFFLYQSLALQKVAKGRFFFRKCNAFFKSPKKVSQIPWNLNKLLTVKGGKFKFKVQDSDLEYLFWRFGDLTNPSHFLKKSHLYLVSIISLCLARNLAPGIYFLEHHSFVSFNRQSKTDTIQSKVRYTLSFVL